MNNTLFSIRDILRYILILSMLVIGAPSVAQTIVYPSNGTNNELFAAKEVRRYIYLRTDQRLPVQGVSDLPESGDLILVANDNNPMVNSLRDEINHTTTKGSIIIKSVESDGRNILVITGNNSASTLIAAYRFAEHLGVGFDLAGDAIPDAKIPLVLTGFDEAGERRFETAGFLPFHDFYAGPDIYSTDDYMTYINQISKLGMNFIGYHTYPTYGGTSDRDNDSRQGPEPTVWIGVEEDVNADGTVNWSYPSSFAHSNRPGEMWGLPEWSTGNYLAGSDQIFPQDFWGSDIFGTTAMPTDIESSNAVFNNMGRMLDKTFDFANDIGIKTALGTEIPMGLEVKGAGAEPETAYDWIRVMPQELQDKLNITGPLDPTLPSKVKRVYRGIFDRIMKTHHLDYYWLWSYEVWGMWEELTSAQRIAFRNDLKLAVETADEMNVPFTLGHAGWMIGDGDDPTLFDDIFPPESPFYTLWDEAHLFDKYPSSKPRVKWSATWTEEDWGLVQPQLEVGRVYNDFRASINRNVDGLIAKGWRTRTVGATTHAIKDALWCYGSTGSEVDKAFPEDKTAWIESVYLDYANRWFGTEVGSSVANILAPLDVVSMPNVSRFPGIINEDFEGNEGDFYFVDHLEELESEVVGTGNKKRFDYLLKTFQSYKIKGDYGKALRERNISQMAGIFNEIIKLDLERMVDLADVGEIMMNNASSWYGETQEWIGDETNLDKTYSGSPFVKVMPVRTQVVQNEDLTLKILAMDADVPTLKYRELGGSDWTSIPTTNVGRSVYSATIPAQLKDFEYYLESGNVVFPVTATSSSPIYQTVIVTTPETDPKRYSISTFANNGSISPDGGYFDENSNVTLTATPDPEYEFVNWTGDINGTSNPLIFKIDGDKTITANFRDRVITQVEDESNQISVYPNPSDIGTFTVSLQNLEGAVELRVTDMNGIVVFQRKALTQHANQVQLPLNGLTKGTYVLTVITKEKVIYEKIVSK